MNLKMLDLFSGIGGFSLAASWTGRIDTVAFCEIEKFPQKVLAKHWPDVPIFDDVRTLTKEVLLERGIDRVDIISGGFPCQPFSLAGKRRGKDDHRHLWPQYLRIIQETRPHWIVGENVVGIIDMELDNIVSDLEGADYSVQAFIIPACAVNAKHKRDRLWVVANSIDSRYKYKVGTVDEKEAGLSQKDRPERSGGGLSFGTVEVERRRYADRLHDSRHDVSNSDSERIQGSEEAGNSRPCGKDSPQHPFGFYSSGEYWSTEPNVGRVANGVSNRVDRIKALGNSIVPQVAYPIFQAIVDIQTLTAHEGEE